MLGSLINSVLSFPVAQSELEQAGEAKEFLLGAKIIDIGHTRAEGGEPGLCIVAEKDGQTLRLVLGYTDLGMWVDEFEKFKSES